MEYGDDIILGFPKIGDIEILHIDVAVIDIFEEGIQSATVVGDFYADNIGELDQVARVGQSFFGFLRVRDEHSDNAELGTVVGNQSGNVDVVVLQYPGNAVHGAFLVGGKNGNLLHTVDLPFYNLVLHIIPCFSGIFTLTFVFEWNTIYNG